MATKHDFKEAEMYAYLHNNFDPELVKTMIDTRYSSNFAKFAAQLPYIEEMKDFIQKRKNLQRIIRSSLAIINVEIMSLDIIKDIGLTIFTLLLYGGPNALFDLPNSYGAAIIISMFASIFIPLLISSPHLTINNLEIFL